MNGHMGGEPAQETLGWGTNRTSVLQIALLPSYPLAFLPVPFSKGFGMF